MKFSIYHLLFAFILIGLGLAWFFEHRRTVELQAEVDRLKSHLGPDYFAYAYHPNPDLSTLPHDPLAKVDKKTSTLYKALITQPEAWSNGLNQYLGIDRIRDTLEPEVTMKVWWRGELKDAAGKRFFVYLADRKRSQAKSANRVHGYFSAYIVTDANNSLVHWNGCDIDSSLVNEIEFSGDTFPGALKYREQSRHNGDTSIEVRQLTKSGITK